MIVLLREKNSKDFIHFFRKNLENNVRVNGFHKKREILSKSERNQDSVTSAGTACPILI